MEPTLLVGDRIFVSKYTYGFSKHSMPFSPNLFDNRIFYKQPERGDAVVFKTPEDNRTDFIKRLIGLPGDEVQFVNGSIILNTKKIKRKDVSIKDKIRCGKFSFDSNSFIENLPNGRKYVAAYNKTGTLQNTSKFKVPNDHFFFLGDNRDCSRDSRFSSIGFVHKNNLVGKAQIVFFSNDTFKSSLLKFWNLNTSLRIDRFFKKIK
jgi:signal peptidase I